VALRLSKVSACSADPQALQLQEQLRAVRIEAGKQQEKFVWLSDELAQVQKSLNTSLQTRRDLLESNKLKMEEIEAALIEFDEHILIKDKEIDNIGSALSRKSHRSCKLRSARLVSKEKELAAKGAEAETHQEVSLNSENTKDFCFDDYKKRFLGEMSLP
jgi:hypothetical protein